MNIAPNTQTVVAVQDKAYPNCSIRSSFFQARRLKHIKNKLLELAPLLKITHEFRSGYLNSSSFISADNNSVDDFIVAYFSKHNAKICLARATEESQKILSHVKF